MIGINASRTQGNVIERPTNHLRDGRRIKASHYCTDVPLHFVRVPPVQQPNLELLELIFVDWVVRAAGR